MALIGATLALLFGSMPLIVVLVARSQAAGAADAAALAAADAAVGFSAGSPCPVAEFVAAANRATLVSCSVDGRVVTVDVVVSAGGFEVPARATAGPPSLVSR